MNDIQVDQLNSTREFSNDTLEDVLTAVAQSEEYNILLWMPFVLIPGCILAARLIKYLYKLHQSRKYGFDEDLLDDPLQQLGLAQLGFTVNRGYDDLNDIRKIRKEQKKLEKRIQKTSRKSPVKGKNLESKEDEEPTPTLISRPLFLAENYLAAFHLQTQKTWTDNFSPEAVRRSFTTSTFGRFWMIFQVACTFVSIINYVFLTYAIQNEEKVFIKYLDVALAAMFLIDYSISIYIAEDRLAFYFDISSLIDLISIVPPFIYLFVREHSQFIWFLGLLRILRASRILRTYRLLSFSETEETRELTIACLTFCNFIFLSASVINALETLNQSKKSDPSLVFWHDSLYYIMVTFSTIGFGDLTPSSIPSRIVVMFLIIFVIIYVPIQTGRIIEIYNASSQYQRARYSPSRSAAHVIIAGSASYAVIVDFCREFFAADTTSKVVILSQTEPNLFMRRLLRHPSYRSRISYLCGSALSATDLKRASAKYATALFLINEGIESESSGSISVQEDEQIRVTRGADAEILMQALVTKKMYPGITILGEVLDIRSEDLSIHCGCDRVLCSDKVTMSILARECLVPGFLALVLNMISTYSNDSSAAPENEPWVYEYTLGAANQVFSFRIPPGLSQIKWEEVVETVFRTFNVTIFAVMSLSGLFVGRLRLNPGNEYVLRGDDVVFCLTSGGDEVVLRLAIQFKDAIPREHLEILELEAEIDGRLETAPEAVPAHEIVGDKLSSPMNLTPGLESEQLNSSRKLSNHIILCGHVTARGIRHFISSIRKAEFDMEPTLESTYQPVRIVCLMDEVVQQEKEENVESEGGIWADIFADSHIEILKGTPLKKTSLLLAGINACKRVVIFSTPIMSSAKAEHAHILPDASSIFIIKMIQEEWPGTNFIVELVSGANVKYFNVSQRNIEWNTDYLRMQSILNNYTLSIHDRITLYKKIRQAGADQETFLYRLYKFIWPYESGGTSRMGSMGYKPVTLLASSSNRLQSKSIAVEDNASHVSSSSSRPILQINTTEMKETNDDDKDPNLESVDSAEGPTGKGSSSVSAAYLQKLVEEAELSESGFAPSTGHHFDKNFAMGRVVPVSFLHSLLAQSYFRPYLGDVVTALASSVIQVKLPENLHGRKYADLMVYMLKRNFIPLGLYRWSNKKQPHSPTGKQKGSAPSVHFGEVKMQYVYTNCRGTDLVDSTDLVFILPSSQ
ncbi:hypothetical protein BC830DRAFT_1061519 [Chytriomyces sp. MP71]|nr:hypothetical protein BC830DRAFT_1061519 [Chytriomyces sp. MP71]